MTVEEIIKILKSQYNVKNVEGMSRFGINTKNTLGIPIPELRKLAKQIGKNHMLAQSLWNTNIHEARILAALIEEAEKVTTQQMDNWVAGFDSWDVCDQVCSNLFDKTPFAFMKAHDWSKNEQEYIRRAGFSLMAMLAVHDKISTDKEFLEFFPIIEKYANDDRNFVKKAVNWALRQIGKRNRNLLLHAIALSKKLEKAESRSARWIAKDALRELTQKQGIIK